MIIIINTINKRSPVPFYYQLYSILLKRIESDEFKPGDPFPTEISLINKYCISRATVRHALMILDEKGYLRREKSKGTFVNDYLDTVGYAGKAKYFSVISSKGEAIKIISKVLEKKIVIPPKNIKKALKLEEGEKAFLLKRIRYAREEPNTFVEDWLPVKMFPNIENGDFSGINSLYQYLEEKYNVLPEHSVRTFETLCVQTEEQMKYLKITKDIPLLYCESTVYDANYQPIEYYSAYIKGKYSVIL